MGFCERRKIYLLEIGSQHDTAVYRKAYSTYKLALRAMRDYSRFEDEHPLIKPWTFYDRWGNYVEYNSEYFVEGSSEYNIDDATWKIWAGITTLEVVGGENAKRRGICKGKGNIKAGSVEAD